MRNSRADSEAGVTMIELSVVMLIIGILAAVAIPKFMSAKSAARNKATVAAASSYAAAVSQYRLDHANFAPGAPGSTDWPTAARGPVNNQLTPPRAYLQGGIPEIVEVGASSPTTGAVFSTSAPAATYKGGTIVYQRVGQSQYIIYAYFDGVLQCVMGNAPATVGKKMCG